MGPLFFHFSLLDVRQEGFTPNSRVHHINSNGPTVNGHAGRMIIQRHHRITNQMRPLRQNLNALISPCTQNQVPTTGASFKSIRFSRLHTMINTTVNIGLTTAQTLITIRGLLSILSNFLNRIIRFRRCQAITTFRFLIRLPRRLTTPMIAFSRTFTLIVNNMTTR